MKKERQISKKATDLEQKVLDTLLRQKPKQMENVQFEK